MWIVVGSNGNAVWETLDGGATLRNITASQSILYSEGNVIDVSYLPDEDRVLLAMTTRLFTRAVGGLTWEPAYEVPAGPRSLLRGALGVANDAGYFAAAELGGSGRGGSAGTGGGAGTAGAAGAAAAGAGGGDSAGASGEESGCGCRVATRRASGAAAFGFALFVLFSVRRRRYSSRHE
jgi:MYXO-CTERM domain-containing protein